MPELKISYQKLINEQLPPHKRKPKFFALAYLLISPIRFVAELFKSFRTEVIYDLSHNSQTIYLTKLLNDRFDPTNKAIQLIDGDFVRKVYLSKRIEQDPLYLSTRAENDPVYLSTRAEYESTHDFVVLVPNTIIFDSTEMKALVNKYKAAGKRYRIDIV